MPELRSLELFNPVQQMILSRSPDFARFIGNASSALALRVAGAGLAFLLQVLLARWMGIDEFGKYAFAWTCVLALGIACQVGLGASTTRLVTQYGETQRFCRVRSIVSFSASVVLLAGGLAAITAVAVIALTQGVETNPNFLPMALAMICVPVLALHEVARGIVRGFGRVTAAYFPGFIARPAMILGCIALLHAMSFTITTPVALTAVLVVLVTITLFQWSRIVSWLPAKATKRKTVWHWRHWLMISLPVVLVDGQYLMLSYMDVIILNAWVPADQLAQYYAAARTVTLLSFVHFAVSAATAHTLAKVHASGDSQQLAAVMKRCVVWTFWPTLACAAVFLPFGHHILNIFGAGFAEGYAILPILTLGILVQAATGPVRYLLTMTGQQNLMAAMLFATAVLNVSLNLWLIPQFGNIGAAVATTVSLSVACICMAGVARKRLGITPIIGWA
ncbi:MAG: oligosaccharide flippase family protein [Rhizobiales bacterium]|nr:oligosaccharide flippase family protein [Hyphomicrobiales bacterium]